MGVISGLSAENSLTIVLDSSKSFNSHSAFFYIVWRESFLGLFPLKVIKIKHFSPKIAFILEYLFPIILHFPKMKGMGHFALSMKKCPDSRPLKSVYLL